MRVVIAQERPEPLEAIRSVLLGLGVDCGPADCVLFGELPVRLAQGGVDLVLVRTKAGRDAALESIRQTVTLTSVPVMAIGPVSDAHHILELGRSGAREYLDEARLPDDLEAALQKLRQTQAVDYGQGSVVAVLSATPGGGVSTVATNLAFCWAGYPDQRVALAELGTEPADLAVNLDLQPKHPAADVFAHWERLDASLLRQALVTHAGRVSVLAHKPETLNVDPIDPEAARRLVVLFKALFTTSVLDLGHLLTDAYFEAARLADTIVLVVRLDVPGLRQARRLLRELVERGVSREDIQLIANRYGQSGQVHWRTAEDTLGARFLEYIPEDGGRINRALNQGEPLVRFAPRATISRRLARLADRLTVECRKGVERAAMKG